MKIEGCGLLLIFNNYQGPASWLVECISIAECRELEPRGLIQSTMKRKKTRRGFGHLSGRGRKKVTPSRAVFRLRAGFVR